MNVTFATKQIVATHMLQQPQLYIHISSQLQINITRLQRLDKES
jgi:hypothetical protein